MEYAVSSGTNLLKKSELNPMKASGYGFGLLILDALKQGVRNFIVGIGGSATNEGGASVLQALGVKFFTEKNLEIKK